MHVGCSWQEKVNGSTLVKKWGIIINSGDTDATIVNLTDNGVICRLSFDISTQLRAELVSTVRANVIATMSDMADDITGYPSHKPTA